MPASEGNAQESLELVRLARIASALDLKPTTVAEIHRRIDDVLQSKSPSADCTTFPYTSSSVLRVKIRALVDADCTWEEIEPFIQALLRQDHSRAACIHAIELAFLIGSWRASAQLLLKLSRRHPQLALDLHASVRQSLLRQGWNEPFRTRYAADLTADPELQRCLPIEHLAILLHYLDKSDEVPAIALFLEFGTGILQVVEQLPEKTGCSHGLICFQLGRAALNQSRTQEAREFLKLIHPDEAEYDASLQLLQRLTDSEARGARAEFEEQLASLSLWQDRIKLVERALQQLHTLGGTSELGHVCLNSFFNSPMDWLPDQTEVWAELGRLIVRHTEFHRKIPNLLNIFLDRLLVFEANAAERALWEATQALARKRQAHLTYLFHVGLLHRCLSPAGFVENFFWCARDYLFAPPNVALARRLPRWSNFLPAFLESVEKRTDISEQLRSRVMATTHIGDLDKHVLPEWVEAYLRRSSYHSSALSQCLQVARLRGRRDLELEASRAQGWQAHLTNRQIDRIWHLACEVEEFDLAWIAATILAARKALSARVRYAWEVSGERRTTYSLQQADRNSFEVCSQIMGGEIDGQILVNLAVVGPCLLLALEERAHGKRYDRNLFPGVEGQKVEAFFAEQRGLSIYGRVGRQFQISDLLAPCSRPPFVRVLPQNMWVAVLMTLADRIGVNGWGWDVERLRSALGEADPHYSGRREFRWLRKAPTEVRVAWYQLHKQLKNLTSEQGVDIMSKFLIRLTTAIYPNHFMALESLQAMRCPVALIWDFENWLLSKPYRAWRIKNGVARRGDVPVSVRLLETILAPINP